LVFIYKWANEVISMTAEGTRVRKDDHIRICLDKDVESRARNGFERYALPHRALPELSLSGIKTSGKFLGKGFRLPFLIGAMTGGSPGTEKINRNLAMAAEKAGIGMGVGSQRAMLEDRSMAFTYQVRDVAPSILLLGNIGAMQLQSYSIREVSGLVSDIGADCLAVHLNAAQELSQPEGDTDWTGVLESIRKLCSRASFPVIVKETGCGISGDVARELEKAGASCIDVSGMGGTSWTRVEHFRGSRTAGPFRDWGIPTAESLRQCREAAKIPLIASGGMRSGLDCAKAIAMGASLAGIALPLLKPASESAGAVGKAIDLLAREFRKAMMLSGSRDLESLSKAEVRRLD
jgi:isopentenyl-diphosphate delta-isomerase